MIDNFRDRFLINKKLPFLSKLRVQLPLVVNEESLAQVSFIVFRGSRCIVLYLLERRQYGIPLLFDLLL